MYSGLQEKLVDESDVSKKRCTGLTENQISEINTSKLQLSAPRHDAETLNLTLRLKCEMVVPLKSHEKRAGKGLNILAATGSYMSLLSIYQMASRRC